MPTFQFRCIFNCWAIISLIFAFPGDLYLFAQEREVGQGQIIKQQQQQEAILAVLGQQVAAEVLGLHVAAEVLGLHVAALQVVLQQHAAPQLLE